MKRHPEVDFVCHLARDLDFLVPDLLGLGWTVRLMKSSSIRYCPGGFWRFLPLGEPGKRVTVIDPDRLGEATGDIERPFPLHLPQLLAGGPPDSRAPSPPPHACASSEDRAAVPQGWIFVPNGDNDDREG